MKPWVEFLAVLTLSGLCDGLATRFQYTARFFCDLVDWYL